MATQIVTIEDLQQFRLQLLDDLKALIQPAANPSQREWLKSSDVRKMLGISHGTLQNLRIKGVLAYQNLAVPDVGAASRKCLNHDSLDCGITMT